jgi:gamma-glutamylcyclotransferase (GGCT)/AIG2-like uncharacterized protein YtfP
MNSGGDLLFVYGTWRSDASEAAVLLDESAWGGATTQGTLYRADASPMLVVEGSGRVHGQIFKVSREKLLALDQMGAQGASSGGLYLRQQVPVVIFGIPDEEIIHAWAYVWSGGVGGAVAIPSGDWLDAEKPLNTPVLTLAAAFLILAFLAGTVALIYYLMGASASGLNGRLVALCFAMLPLGSLLFCHAANRKREQWVVLRSWLQGVAFVLLILALFPAVI